MSKKSSSGSTPRKQSQPPISTIASKVLSGDKKATPTEVKRLAASVLSQDETRGQSKKKT